MATNTMITKEELDNRITELEMLIAQLRNEQSGKVNLFAVFAKGNRHPFMENCHAQKFVEILKKHETENADDDIIIKMIEADKSSELYEAAMQNSTLWCSQV